jgi:hypothetical protein
MWSKNLEGFFSTVYLLYMWSKPDITYHIPVHTIHKPYYEDVFNFV